MKGKKMTYLLLVGVAVVWGIVVYRIAGTLGGNNEFKYTAPVTQEDEIVYEEPDTFTIVANYRDPFLGKTVRKKTPPAPAKTQQPPKKEKDREPEKEEEKIDWSFVVYRGIFKNNKQDRKTGLVTVRNKDYVVLEGDSVNQLYVQKIFKDSIGVNYQGSFTYIKRK